MEEELPHSLEAEKCIIGALLISSSAIEDIHQRLSDDSFYFERNRVIFKTILDLYDDGIKADAIAVVEALKSNGVLDKAGGIDYIKEIVTNTATTAHLDHYVNIVEMKATKRRLIGAANEILKRATSETEDTTQLVDMAEQLIYDISKGRISSFFVPISDLVKGTVDYIEKIASREEKATGLKTGFEDFDELTTGLQKQDLIIIAGRPTCGKTSFVLDIARFVALELKKPVAIFSLEMSMEQLSMRILCAEAKVNAHRIRSGFPSDADRAPIYNAASRLYDAKIYIDDTPALSVLEMRAKARRLASQENLALIIVDYLQLMRGRTVRPESRQQEVAEISRFLKSLSKELNIPIVAVSQLSRDIEKHGNRRPQLSDLRESGALEQDADIVAFLWRHPKRGEDDDVDDYEFSGVTELIIGKQRNGPTGTVLLVFREDYMSFADMTREDQNFYWQRMRR
ncbi:MAG: replicative DNA helicase [bacterium]